MSIQWGLGKGEIIFWQDNWLGTSSIDSILNTHTLENTKANYFFDNGTWNVSKLLEVLPPILVESVCSIPLLLQEDDKILFTLSSSGGRFCCVLCPGCFLVLLPVVSYRLVLSVLCSCLLVFQVRNLVDSVQVKSSWYCFQVTLHLGRLRRGPFWRWQRLQLLLLEVTNFVFFLVPFFSHHSMFLGFYVFLFSRNLELVGFFLAFNFCSSYEQ
ncbi:hypothetical protein M5K25_010780 [Dendrobium thyrsiflorum]|uniref:Uncharacterized protein n=1 Tax=Dendrobium thyrsiflorum TaxID=117978 RepID=A0ABD0V168_DENTH